MDLITGNPAKFAPFKELLTELGITVVVFSGVIPEIQSDSMEEVVVEKAKYIAKLMNKPCLVDDMGLFLSAYPGFPGSYTKYAIKSLGVDGFTKLMESKTKEATMVCLLAYWENETPFFVRGEVLGKLEPTESTTKNSMPLNDWFTPYDNVGKLQHRRNAFEELRKLWARKK